MSVSKHVVENDMSFFIKVNGCQEKQQENLSYSLFYDVTKQREKWTAQTQSYNLYCNYIMISFDSFFFVL